METKESLAYKKVMNTINSMENMNQYYVAKNLVNNFMLVYGGSLGIYFRMALFNRIDTINAELKKKSANIACKTY